MPWSILALLYGVPAPAGLYSAFGHAHELLIGYAMLVVAGYLLGPQEGRKILLLIGVWLLARIGFLSLPGGLMAVAGAVLVAGLTAYWTVPRFARSARSEERRVGKECRNRGSAELTNKKRKRAYDSDILIEMINRRA